MAHHFSTVSHTTFDPILQRITHMLLNAMFIVHYADKLGRTYRQPRTDSNIPPAHLPGHQPGQPGPLLRLI